MAGIPPIRAALLTEKFTKTYVQWMYKSGNTHQQAR